MRDHNDTTPEDEQRDELLGTSIRSLDTPEHADGFFAALDARLDEVDAEPDAVLSPRRLRFASQRWLAFGSVTAAAAALIVAGFLLADGPQKAAVAPTAAPTAAETLAGGAALQRAPADSAKGSHGLGYSGTESAPDASSALKDSTRSNDYSDGRYLQVPRPLPDLATASDLLGMTVRPLKDARAGGIATIGLGEVPAKTDTGSAVTHREVVVAYKQGLELVVSRTRLEERPPGSGHWVELSKPEDYEDTAWRAALSSSVRDTMPQLADVAGHPGILETETTPSDRPVPLSVRWNDANGFYSLRFTGVPDPGISVDDLIAIAGSMY